MTVIGVAGAAVEVAGSDLKLNPPEAAGVGSKPLIKNWCHQFELLGGRGEKLNLVSAFCAA